MSQATIKKTDDISVNIGVNEDHRAEVAEQLATFLATTYTLYLKTLYYHWNVTGHQFHSLHELFEGQYEDLHAAGDELAERIRSLGHFTPGTYKKFGELSAIKEDEELPANADTMVRNLLKDNETCSMEARKVLKIAENAGDEVTVDMMVERMSVHDEASWMLRSSIG